MTQDVQPLTWQKRTNLEEHQQFFSKINEIIDNLAPTVDEAEAAIAQATAAIASANDAIATANAASAAASAAATQAQTAATTVAGYDTRLTAAEGDIDTNAANITALQAADQTMAGNISALGTRMTAAESKNSQQDTAIAALQTADAQNVKIDNINDYAVGLTGAQDVFGSKKYQITPYAKPNTSKALITAPSENQYVKLYDIAAGGSPRIIHGMIKSLWFIQNRFEIEFWIGGFNSSSTFSLTRSIGSNANLRVTRDANNVWGVWFRYESNTSVNNRAFSEIIDQFYSYGYEIDLITVIKPADQVILAESSAEWSNYTIIENQEIA